MAELTFKSAGVSTREIDLSQPSRSGPVGIPAGIIGTANEGPAFVPLTFGNYSDFAKTFGKTDGEKFGPLAVNQWLNNAQSVTYIRVLGTGNGEGRQTNGNVTNAGFVVGDEIIGTSGASTANSYATSGGPLGRTYFLGSFMSESNGSTVFSSAGIQNNNKSVAILRGVLLAPSGVILHLSSAYDGDAPVKSESSIASSGQIMGRHGFLTGSVNLSSKEFVMLMNGYKNSDSSKKTYVTASFDTTAPNYFANIFNKDPLKIQEEGHLLYSQYDIFPSVAVVTGSGVISEDVRQSEEIAFLLTGSNTRHTDTSSLVNYESFEDRFRSAYTPWVISQRPHKNLFRIHLLSPGKETSNKYKFSIENIKKSSVSGEFGKFDFVVRDFNDSDANPKVLESFRGVNLDAQSDRYIGRVIGDQHVYYDWDTQKIRVDGIHPVQSRFVRVEMSDDVSNRVSYVELSLPMGFRGPNHLVTSGSLLSPISDGAFSVEAHSLIEPPIPYKSSITLGSGVNKKIDKRLYWGVDFIRTTDLDETNKSDLVDETIQSYVKYFPDFKETGIKFSAGDNAGAADESGSVLDSDRFNKNLFTLEHILVRTGSENNYAADQNQWVSASYYRGGSVAGNENDKTRYLRVDDLLVPGNSKFAKFTFFAQGGFDGVDIFNINKMKMTNTAIYNESLNEDNPLSSNTISSFRKAVDIMGSKSDVDIQLLAIPGIRHSTISDYAIQKVEERFDAMYIMDIDEYDENGSYITSTSQKPNVTRTVGGFPDRDSSFTAAYFPDVLIKDPSTKTLVQVPPSVAVLGAYALNDKVAHPWYAPAGYTRGALKAVELPSVKLNRTNLDDLYEADINPIVEFTGAGITIWGQKTLQASNSALDRVNVRRLLIDVRRKVKNVANTLLFEPNRAETLEKFNSLVNPILQKIQDQSGIDKYKAVIDTSTTTQADIENNTIRGKIYLQPTRSVEFVALDFVVTNAGSNI